MISNKIRETRRGKTFKMTKNIERLYKEGKCKECSVVVTRMDFAKILGKFTKVKIQYESSSTSKTKNNQQTSHQSKSPNSNARLKSNENGMVLIHRKAYTQHPVKELLNSKKPKVNEKLTPRLKENSRKLKETSTKHQVNNILKENNRLKNLDSHCYIKNVIHSNLKRYGIIFVNPSDNENIDNKSKSSLEELLPSIDKNILPSQEWYIDYLPKNGEPKEDKVYDRIAAELEDLMNSEKPTVKAGKEETLENKDDFPSIMDILNENTENTQVTNQNNSTEFKSNLESSDVEAMLLGKSNETSTLPVSTQMEVDSTDVGNLMDVVQLNAIEDGDNKFKEVCDDGIDNPHSPSILDEALQKGIEEHLPISQPPIVDLPLTESTEKHNTSTISDKTADMPIQNKINLTEMKNQENSSELNMNTITHVVFKKSLNGQCYKSVTCPKNLKYSIELQGKSVELLGAPKFITSLEDLRVLLEIVNDSELHSLYVLQ